MTLIELLVAMMLFGVLSIVIVSSLVSITGTFNTERAATESTNVAAMGMNELTRVIRSGTEISVQGQTLNDPVFVSAKREEMTLYAYLDTDSMNPFPLKANFSINASRELVETRWKSRHVAGTKYFEFLSTVDSQRRIASQIVSPTGTEPYLFRYFGADGVELVPPTVGAFSVAQLRSIASVEITMKVQADITARSKPVTLINRVGMPNLGISRVGQ